MKLQMARGVKDFPPEEKIVKQEVMDKLRTIFEKFGYNPLETPLIERFDVLASKYAGGSEIMKETFQFTDQGGRELGLRYDLTVPFSRFVGMNPTLKMPFKRYQMGRVFRDGPIKLGRYREFWQCDIDVVGTKSMRADAECVMVAQKGFQALNFNIIIKVNNRKILDGFMEYAGVVPEKRMDAILSIDKYEKVGEKMIVDEMREKGIPSEAIEKIKDLFGITGDTQNKITILKNLLKENEGIKEIEELFSFLPDQTDVIFDPTLARGLSYYTGTIFEAFLKSGRVTSSLAGGGRYDKMIGDFLGGKREIPAVGISFGIAPICDTMNDLNEGKKLIKCVTKVFIIPIGTYIESVKISNQLRENNIKTEIDIASRGISKNLDYANALSIPYVIFIGEDEIKQNKLKLKNMESGDEEMLNVESIIQKLKE
ncbi:histidine--tRNA ligase [Nanoarchaeota archaeon]